MALDFPSAPVVGQTYNGYIFDGTKWKASPTSVAPSVVSATPPTNPTVGDMWFNSTDGTMYFYYNDGNTSQWVESRAPIVANGYYSPNYIINGAFEINQRGLTSTTSSVYGFDRWLSYNVGGTLTYSSQTPTPGSTIGGHEVKNFARLVTSGQSGVSDQAVLVQYMEDVRLLAGKTVTVSFYAKSGSGTPNIGLAFSQIFGTGGSPSSTIWNAASSVIVMSGGTAWTRYSATVTLPSIAGKTLGTTDNTSTTGLTIVVSAGATSGAVYGTTVGIQNNTFDIWGVQVELGSAATTFRRNANSIQGELAACHRYYQRFTGIGAYTPIGGSGFITGSTNARIHFVPLAPGRVPPTSVTLTNFGIYDTQSVISLSGAYGLVSPTTNYFAFDATISGGTQYRPVFPYGTGAGAGVVEFNMEL